MKKLLGIIGVVLYSLAMATAQEAAQAPQTSWSAYVEPYYAVDFNKPVDGNRPSFLYAYNRHNEVNINLGQIKGSYTSNLARANVALAAGTYMNANYAAEPGVLKNILEMNAGLRLSKKHDLWLDAGVFGSHIGFESAIGKDCRSLTRSMMAENSPYFESGAKLTFLSNNGKWTMVGLLLNGWQRIVRVSGNSLPSFGTQVQYKPNDKIVINSSSFIGTDKPDNERLMRYFHNFYTTFQLQQSWEATLAIDIGFQQNAPESHEYDTWLSTVGQLRFKWNEKLALALRGEYFHDEADVIVSSRALNGFEVAGVSLNVDYAISSTAVWRIEGRHFSSREDIFTKRENSFSRVNTCISSCIAVNF